MPFGGVKTDAIHDGRKKAAGNFSKLKACSLCIAEKQAPIRARLCSTARAFGSLDIQVLDENWIEPSFLAQGLVARVISFCIGLTRPLATGLFSTSTLTICRLSSSFAKNRCRLIDGPLIVHRTTQR
jgi:hypothetical protein